MFDGEEADLPSGSGVTKTSKLLYVAARVRGDPFGHHAVQSIWSTVRWSTGTGWRKPLLPTRWALRWGQPATQMNVVAMPLMPGQCIVATRVPAELQIVKDSGLKPMPSTPSTTTPPSTSDEEAEDHASAASQDEPELHNRQERMPATKPRSWLPGPVAAGLVCNPAADFFAQHSQERLQRQLQADRQEVTKALGALKGHVWDLSCHQAGCRLVQLALESASQQQASELASELKGHVQQAMASPHANYVVQKIVTRLLWSSCSFVAEELLGAAVQMSHQRFGCRIFCRLLEFHARRQQICAATPSAITWCRAFWNTASSSIAMWWRMSSDQMCWPSQKTRTPATWWRRCCARLHLPIRRPCLRRCGHSWRT
ncbi:unnamed protein product [Effrenium voratum]|nr:unnamed protein product [Effrenium voratum]